MKTVVCAHGFYWECPSRIDGRGCEIHVDRIKFNKMASELENSCERNEHRTIKIKHCQKEKVPK